MAGEAPGVVTSAPVVPAVDTAPDIVSTAETLTEAPEGGEQPEATPEKTLTQSEVNKLIAKEKAKESRRVERAIRAEVERDLLRQQLDQRNQPHESRREPGEPQVKDYQDYEEFLIAKAVYRMRSDAAQESQRSQQQTAQQQHHQAEADLGRALKERLEAIEDEVPDIIELVRGNVPFTDPMAHFIAGSELGGKVAHYLATNAKETARIADLSAANQFRELVKLENKITAPPKPTQTPAPIVPNRGNSAGIKPLLDTNQEEFEERRRAFIAKKSGSRK